MTRVVRNIATGKFVKILSPDCLYEATEVDNPIMADIYSKEVDGLSDAEIIEQVRGAYAGRPIPDLEIIPVKISVDIEETL